MIAGISKTQNFFEVKGVLEYLLKRLGITNYSLFHLLL